MAILFNLAFLFVANNLLGWDLIPFLTGDFARVLWIVNLSILATIVANLAYLWYDPAWFKSVCQICLGGISMLVSIRMLQVFPFDFSGSQFDWEPVARFLLILGVVAVGIGIVVEVVKLIRSLLPSVAASPIREWGDNTSTHRNERRTT
ncbi:MAG TPA: hypothetical protein VK990_03655 [Acidimicrobiia bacterium]|nr:hypothetical protein [Acidimicrobiia bacterium]